MSSHTTPCPGRRDLEDLLDGKAAADSAVTDHVGDCVGCQQELDGLACDDPRFSDVVRHIDRRDPPSGSAYWRALEPPRPRAPGPPCTRPSPPGRATATPRPTATRPAS